MENKKEILAEALGTIARTFTEIYSSRVRYICDDPDNRSNIAIALSDDGIYYRNEEEGVYIKYLYLDEFLWGIYENQLADSLKLMALFIFCQRFDYINHREQFKITQGEFFKYDLFNHEKFQPFYRQAQAVYVSLMLQKISSDALKLLPINPDFHYVSDNGLKEALLQLREEKFITAHDNYRRHLLHFELIELEEKSLGQELKKRFGRFFGRGDEDEDD